jgi:hypothetical protein
MDRRSIEQAARDQGFQVSRTTRGHSVFYAPDPSVKPIYGSGTPGDRRAILNLLAQLRRAGLVYPPRRGSR